MRSGLQTILVHKSAQRLGTALENLRIGTLAAARRLSGATVIRSHRKFLAASQLSGILGNGSVPPDGASRKWPSLPVSTGVCALCLVILGVNFQPLPAAGPVDYTNAVKPILKVSLLLLPRPAHSKGQAARRYRQAHAGRRPKRSRFCPGKSGESLLIEKITHGKGPKRMPPPPKNALTESQIVLLKTWIDQGAKAPADELPADPAQSLGVQSSRPTPASRR